MTITLQSRWHQIRQSGAGTVQKEDGTPELFTVVFTDGRTVCYRKEGDSLPTRMSREQFMEEFVLAPNE